MTRGDGASEEGGRPGIGGRGLGGGGGDPLHLEAEAEAAAAAQAGERGSGRDEERREGIGRRGAQEGALHGLGRQVVSLGSSLALRVRRGLAHARFRSAAEAGEQGHEGREEQEGEAPAGKDQTALRVRIAPLFGPRRRAIS